MTIQTRESIDARFHPGFKGYGRRPFLTGKCTEDIAEVGQLIEVSIRYASNEGKPRRLRTTNAQYPVEGLR